jgi:hypothetical protein
MLRQYQLARVVQLKQPLDAYDGWGANQRAPQVTAPGLPETYIVESCGPGGVTIWLADFLADELEPQRHV